MLTRDTMRGLYSLPPTPFERNGNFWESAYRENLRTLMEFKFDAIASPGSNGEWWSMSGEDRRRQMEILAEECRGRTATIACCSSTYTADSIEKTRWAEEIGIDAVMNVPPFYYPLTDDELRRYYHDLAEACPQIGIVVYNFPVVAQALSPDLMNCLANELPTLCGSKESHQDFSTWLKLHRNNDLAIMSAVERIWFTACMRQRAPGMFSVLSASVPGLVSTLFGACVDEDWSRADELERELWNLVQLIENIDYLAPYNPIARNKAIVNACGWLKAGVCRPPLTSVPDELSSKLRNDLASVCEKWMKT